MTTTPKPETPTEADADFPEKEIARRRDEVTRRMLNTPYSPQTPKNAKAKRKKKAPAKA
jgi:hypothetical protein